MNRQTGFSWRSEVGRWKTLLRAIACFVLTAQLMTAPLAFSSDPDAEPKVEKTGGVATSDAVLKTPTRSVGYVAKRSA